MISQVTCSVILDTRRANKKGFVGASPFSPFSPDEKENLEYPLVLRVYNPYVSTEVNRRYFRLKQSLTEDEYKKITSGNAIRGARTVVNHLNEVKKNIADWIKRADDIKDELGERFTFVAFKNAFFNEAAVQVKNSVLQAYQSFIKELEDNKQVRTSFNFECAKRSLSSFVGGDGRLSTYQFQDITPKWLKSYEVHMIENEKSYSTISMYLRTLRQLFNEAIANGTINRVDYPFGKKKDKKYEIPEAVNFKRALEKSEIESLINYKAVPASAEEFARDMWVFSYLCNGANLKDIARLKNKDIDYNIGEISFIRAKTISNRKKKDLVTDITPHLIEIIDRYRDKDKSENDYVFNIISPGLTPRQELYKLRDEIKYINKHLKNIATELKFSGAVNLTTMTARHSHATMLQQAGVPISFISESLGHSNVLVTENYLGGFTKKDRAKHKAHLTDFEETK